MNYKTYKEYGVSLIELMISIAIGSLLMVGLVSSFQNSSQTKRELERSGQLIENGRYAINLLSEDIRHGGFYGAYYDLGAPPGALPDPCAIDLASLEAAMPLPIQGYNAAAGISATTCGTGGLALLTPANLVAGSDILVVRRVNTTIYQKTDKDAPPNDVVVDGIYNQEVYLVANSLNKSLIQAATNNNVTADAWTILRKYPHRAATTPKAESRKLVIHIYFVAPCSFGMGANGVCNGSSGEDKIPTLKRLELRAVDTSSPQDNVADVLRLEITPLVEGVEMLKVEYGIDNSPTAVNPLTKYSGDGIPDTYVLSAASMADWQAIVSLKIFVLARTLTPTQSYTDAKSFVIGSIPGSTTTVAAAGDSFRRNLFTAEIRPTNMAGRREIPE